MEPDIKRYQSRHHFYQTLRQLLPTTRICITEIRLSFDCMYFPFFFFCIYIEKDIRISASKYA